MRIHRECSNYSGVEELGLVVARQLLYGRVEENSRKRRKVNETKGIFKEIPSAVDLKKP